MKKLNFPFTVFDQPLFGSPAYICRQTDGLIRHYNSTHNRVYKGLPDLPQLLSHIAI